MLQPAHERLLAVVKASSKLFADETTAPVLDPGRGRTKIGQLWAYARDRPWGGTDPPGVAYVYAPDRKAKSRSLTSLALRASCRPTAIAVIGRSPSATMCNLPFASLTSAVPSTSSLPLARRQLPARRSNASQVSMPSKRKSVAAAPRSGVPFARIGADRSLMIWNLG